MTLEELGEYGRLTALYYELQQVINKGSTAEQRQQFQDVRRRLGKISEFILGCPDPLIKELMILRFTRFLGWEEVAMRVGGYNSSGSCRMLVIRYLNRENKNAPTK